MFIHRFRWPCDLPATGREPVKFPDKPGNQHTLVRLSPGDSNMHGMFPPENRGKFRPRQYIHHARPAARMDHKSFQLAPPIRRPVYCLEQQGNPTGTNKGLHLVKAGNNKTGATGKSQKPQATGPKKAGNAVSQIPGKIDAPTCGTQKSFFMYCRF
jgi:hypothetical protein